MIDFRALSSRPSQPLVILWLVFGLLLLQPSAVFASKSTEHHGSGAMCQEDGCQNTVPDCFQHCVRQTLPPSDLTAFFIPTAPSAPFSCADVVYYPVENLESPVNEFFREGIPRYLFETVILRE